MINVGENYKVSAMRLDVVLWGKIDKENERSKRFTKMWEERKAAQGAVSIESDDEVGIGKDWEVLGYYCNVENALLALLRMEVEKSELQDLQTVLTRIKEVEKLIRDLGVNETFLSLRKNKEAMDVLA